MRPLLPRAGQLLHYAKEAAVIVVFVTIYCLLQIAISRADALWLAALSWLRALFTP